MNAEENKILDGVGKDAEIVTNDKGGKQSKTPMALHLVDPQFIIKWVECQYKPLTNNVHDAIDNIAKFMVTNDNGFILTAITYLESDRLQQLIRIAKVLQYGADRYEPNNWRLIPQESHINHALIHLVAHLMGDTQDDHLDHALCRLMMAYATEKSYGFEYNRYVDKQKLQEIEDIFSEDNTVGTIVETASSHPDFKPIQKLQEGYDKFMCNYKYDCHYKEDNK